jgi:hypothetical protein
MQNACSEHLRRQAATLDQALDPTEHNAGKQYDESHDEGNWTWEVLAGAPILMSSAAGSLGKESGQVHYELAEILAMQFFMKVLAVDRLV